MKFKTAVIDLSRSSAHSNANPGVIRVVRFIILRVGLKPRQRRDTAFLSDFSSVFLSVFFVVIGRTTRAGAVIAPHASRTPRAQSLTYFTLSVRNPKLLVGRIRCFPTTVVRGHIDFFFHSTFVYVSLVRILKKKINIYPRIHKLDGEIQAKQ